jgi:hypothetical protein
MTTTIDERPPEVSSLIIRLDYCEEEQVSPEHEDASHEISNLAINHSPSFHLDLISF